MQDFITIIGILSPICAIIFGWAAFARNGKKDTADEAKNDATVFYGNRVHQKRNRRHKAGTAGAKENEYGFRYPSDSG